MSVNGPRDFLREFFLAPAHARTWLNLVYLLLAFPLGLLYFVFLTVGGAVGLSLALLWVGLPLLLVTVGAWWTFAAFERILGRHLLGLDLTEAARPWETADRMLGKLRAHFTAASTWKDLAFVLLKFPLGVASFVIVTAFGGATGALLLAPATGAWAGHHVISIGGWQISSGWEAVLSIALGLLGFFLTLAVVNGLAALWRLLTTALLSEDHALPPAAPTTPTDHDAYPAAREPQGG